MKMLRNYQFHGHNVENNSLIALNISIHEKIHSKTITGYSVQDKTFKINEISADKHIIKKIDGKGARSAIFDKLNLKIEEKDAVYQLYKNAFYYPLGFKKDDLWHACMIGLIYGENLIFSNKIDFLPIYNKYPILSCVLIMIAFLYPKPLLMTIALVSACLTIYAVYRA